MVVISFSRSSLYDGEDQQEFLQSLSARIKNHDKDIERMCNKNYQGFIESVSELHKVKSEANKLKVRYAMCICMLVSTQLVYKHIQLLYTVGHNVVRHNVVIEL